MAKKDFFDVVGAIRDMIGKGIDNEAFTNFYVVASSSGLQELFYQMFLSGYDAAKRNLEK